MKANPNYEPIYLYAEDDEKGIYTIGIILPNGDRVYCSSSFF
jgi:hypothetical protein